MTQHSNNYPKLHNAAWPGVVGKGDGGEPLVSLRYFGPNVHKSTPKIGDHRKNAR